MTRPWIAPALLMAALLARAKAFVAFAQDATPTPSEPRERKLGQYAFYPSQVAPTGIET